MGRWQLVAIFTKLDHHLAVVDRHVVLVQLGLVTDLLQKGGLLGRVLGMGRLLGQLRLHLLDRPEHLALHVRHDKLGGEVDDLGREGKVDDLAGESVRVNLPVFGRDGLPLGSKSLRRELEDVKIGHEDFSKGHVDKGGQEDAQVRGDEVNDEDLLDQGSLVGCDSQQAPYVFSRLIPRRLPSWVS
jgi:hypothetical protein